MPSLSAKSFPLYLTFTIALGLLAYTAYRAVHLSMTHDESCSYLFFLDDNLWDVFFKKTGWPSANLQWLNSAFMQVSAAIFGHAEWSLRLHSLLGHLLYMLFSFLLLKNTAKNNWLLLAGFIVLNFNPYILDFFSLARGYGLALAWMLASLYYFSTWINSRKYGHLILVFVTAILSILGNFTALNYFAAIFAAVVYVLLIKWKETQFKSKWLNFLIPLLASGILYVFLRTPIHHLREKGELYYGAKTAYETLYTLIKNSLYGYKYLKMYNVEFFAATLLLLLTIAILRSFVQLIKSPKNKSSLFYFIVAMMPLGIFIGTVLQHELFGTLYLWNRTALLFVPLCALSVAYLWVDVWSNSDKWTMIFPIIIGLFCAVHLGKSSNLTYTREWVYDASTKDMLLYMQNKTPQSQPVKLGVYWLYQPTTAYYFQTLGLDFSPTPIREDGLRQDTFFDYYYVQNEDVGKISPEYQVEKIFGVSGTLMKRK